MRRLVAAVGLAFGTPSCGDDVAGLAIETSSSGQTDDTDAFTSSTGEPPSETSSNGNESDPECGNARLEPGEQCDDGNLLNDDGCSKSCLEEFCGDGVLQASEGCDLGPDNADFRTCTSACLKNVCGDGHPGPDETCDDGNTDDDDGCSSACTLETCGNGRLEAGEQCDDGNNNNDDGCTTLCAPPTCGDGILSSSAEEDCDDANPDNADACPNDCTVAVCGDSFVEGSEECDEGDLNGNGISMCSAACTINICGDGYFVPDVEACDDGATTGNGMSACTPACSLNVCGDAYQQFPLEACDAGERNGYVPCSTSCEVVPEVVEVAFAWNSTCAVYADASVRCWGRNRNGALAIPGFPEAEWLGDEPGEMPPPVAALGGGVLTLSAGSGPGGDSWCAVRTDGEVVCWGSGRATTDAGVPFYSGVLGPFSDASLAIDPIPSIGDDGGELPPTPIPLGVPAVAISVADTSACAVGDDGSLRCWGYARPNVFGEPWPNLGYGTIVHRAAPTDFPPPPVNLGAEIAAADHDGSRTCTLGLDHQVRCFGTNATGRLGVLDAPAAVGTSIDPPVPVALGGDVATLGTGESALCVQLVDGTGRCFGWNGALALGTGSDEHIGDDPGEMPPAPLELGTDPIAKLAGGWRLMCALSETGGVRCWGHPPRTYGYEMPDEVIGDDPGEMPPSELELDGFPIDLFTGLPGRACVIYDDHSVACWGRDVLGLGVNAYQVGDTPGEMPPPRLRLYP